MMIKHYLKVAFRNLAKYKVQKYCEYFRIGSRLCMLCIVYFVDSL